ncbi:hypothetical protein PUN28_001735 [Cardiocondyla obscurior]|uniref:Secreted protein n=1 Tax=Cardiocondyla obscurior TaxID=286306 RepID=A0AAW2GR03_9HYME
MRLPFFFFSIIFSILSRRIAVIASWVRRTCSGIANVVVSVLTSRVSERHSLFFTFILSLLNMLQPYRVQLQETALGEESSADGGFLKKKRKKKKIKKQSRLKIFGLRVSCDWRSARATRRSTVCNASANVPAVDAETGFKLRSPRPRDRYRVRFGSTSESLTPRLLVGINHRSSHVSRAKYTRRHRPVVLLCIMHVHCTFDRTTRATFARDCDRPLHFVLIAIISLLLRQFYYSRVVLPSRDLVRRTTLIPRSVFHAIGISFAANT